MLYISSRQALSNENRLSVTDSYWDISIVRGSIKSQQVTEDKLLARIRGLNVLVVVHGYNNEFEDIPRAFSMIENRRRRYLSDFYDLLLGYTWPGGDDSLDYFAAKRRSGIVAPRFAGNLLRLHGAAASIDVMSHSMGARVVLSAYPLLPMGTVRCNLMMASAVDNESIESGQKYFRAMRNVGESLLMHSRNDSVLRLAYRAAEWDRALGYSGPEDPGDIRANLTNTTIANCKRLIESHGAYKSSDPVFSLIRDWLQGEIQEQFVTI